MEIKLDELHVICEKLFQYLKEIGIDSIDMDVDYYWNIPGDEIYHPYKKPENLDMGQISDDWQELQKLLNEDREPFIYELVWLAAVIRAIGERITLSSL